MKRFSLILQFITFSVVSFAGITTSTLIKKGNQISSANIKNEDDKYQYMVGNPNWTSQFFNKSVKDKVTLKFTGESKTVYSSPWSLQISFTLKSWNSSGQALPNKTGTLTINYNPNVGVSFKDEDIFTITGGFKTELIINSHTITGLTNIPNDVVLQSDIEVERFYFLNRTNIPAVSTTINSYDKKLEFNWTNIIGAEEYDLEWVFINRDRPFQQADFKNATRISTPDNHYTINLAFDAGTLYYRVRAVGRHGSDYSLRLEGGWSATNNGLALSNNNTDRNWEYSANFAEEGKAKEVINFFDGSGRNRQSVTQLNTENTDLVTETIYDYEGRPVIQTLPAPSNDFSNASGATDSRRSTLDFYKNFSINTSMLPYSKKEFDSDAFFSGTTCSETGPNGMGDTKGASNYYSEKNGERNKGFNAALPDAEGFPFTQKTFNPDGRVKAESGVGPDSKIGSGHEIKYFYATPLQPQLDRLFGNEVGEADHYSQKAIMDPNGQLSVSYTDLSGKVIATALVGTKPSNVSGIQSYVAAQTFTSNFNNLNKYVATEEAIITDCNFLVSSPGAYNFSYTLQPEQYTALCNGAATNTYSCKYDLLITVYDNCDQLVSDASGLVVNQPFPIDGNLFLTSPYFKQDFTINFNQVGVYKIRKKLILNEAAVTAAAESYRAYLGTSNCLGSLTNLQSTYAGAINYDCESTCEGYCAAEAIKHGFQPGTQAYGIFVDGCIMGSCTDTDNEEGCGALLEQLEEDFSPGGQYFDNMSAGKTTQDPNWLNGYVWQNGDFASWVLAGFRNPSGGLITSWDDLKTYWQPEFVTKSFVAPINGKHRLVEFHPEYCHYSWCISQEPSAKFDAEIFNGDEISWAEINPSPATPYLDQSISPIGQSLLDLDPYFNTGQGTSQKSTMAAALTNYNGSTMWAKAGTDAGCTNCDDQWVVFRTYYLGKKKELEHAKIISNGCNFLCDNTNPPDQIADCGSSNTIGFEIREPDNQGIMNNTYALINEDKNSLTETSATVNNFGGSLGQYDVSDCSIPARCTILHDPPDYWGVGAQTSSIYFYANSIQISSEVTVPTGVETPQNKVLRFVNSINSYISVPDYTAAVDPSNPKRFIISSPKSNGANYNGIAITWSACTGFINPSTTLSGGVTQTCHVDVNCLCSEFKSMIDLYISEGDNTASSWYNKIATNLNNNYTLATPITAAQCSTWVTNCTTNKQSSPLALNSDGEDDPLITQDTVPDAIRCDVAPDNCTEDATTISNFYATEEYNNLIDAAVANFIKEYRAKCLGGAFRENFSVEYDEFEHHYTLYYYDRAGNLVRTVPPEGVRKLTQAQTNDVDAYRKNSSLTPVYPTHNLVSNYKYNSLNQLIQQSTPDGGTTDFYYDNVGRLRFSQNDKQRNSPSPTASSPYSYTKYDAQGRIIEVGESNETGAVNEPFLDFVNDYLNDESFPANGTEVTRTFYDAPLNNTINVLFPYPARQENLRSRIASVTYEDVSDGNNNTYDHATHYSYDIHGNVDYLIQETPELAPIGQAYKKMEYTYDLVSGNVNEIAYQKGQYDQFFHKYTYDADNRIKRAYTSKDGEIWDNDAKYFYYLHGPLARTEIGDQKVQALDYAYTLQGWLKTVNDNTLNSIHDIGKDGVSTKVYIPGKVDIHKNIARDVFGYSLHYFTDDYKAISTHSNNFLEDVDALNVSSNDLFNGNIKMKATALMKPNVGSFATPMAVMATHYNYDQLNRIVNSNSLSTITGLFANATSNNNEYATSYTYDGNGNILTLTRNGVDGNTPMDNLNYKYDYSGSDLNSNRLNHVNDAITSTYSDDIDDQGIYDSNNALTFNYQYDQLGNLISDQQENISSIGWSVYGKIKSITRSGSSGSNNPDMEFAYDASGNRVRKTVKPRTAGVLSNENDWISTYYVRDASGNIMATYERSYTHGSGSNYTDKLDYKETNLYGSSRLGIYTDPNPSEVSRNFTASINASTRKFTNIIYPAQEIAQSLNCGEDGCPVYYRRFLGNKQYELNDHLGNVQVTVTDKKILHETNIFHQVEDFEDCPGASNTMPAHSGEYSSMIVDNQPYSCGYDQPVEAGDVITATIWARYTSDGNPPRGVLVVKLLNSAGQLVVYGGANQYFATSFTVVSANTWAQYTFTYTVPPVTGTGYTISVYGRNHEAWGVWVDDLDLTITHNGALSDKYYEADVVSATDYYPFGATMPGRSFNSSDYDRGFNGQLKDDEIKGISGSSYDFKFRMYDPRLGKFLSTDPLEKEFAWNSPYAFAENRPIDGVDLEGKEWANIKSKLKCPGELLLQMPSYGNTQQQQYSISIQDSKKSYESLKSDFKKAPEKILSNSKATFHSPVDGEGKPSQFKVGSYIKIDINGFMNNGYVEVLDITDKDGTMSATFGTLEGHIEVGTIKFSFTDKGNGKIDFTISSESAIDQGIAGIPYITEPIARREQKKSWNEVLDNVLKKSGGKEEKRKIETKDIGSQVSPTKTKK